MRLPTDARIRLLALGVTAALAGCGIVGGGDRPAAVSSAAVRNGPAADYPMVLGEPFTVDGELYTPADTMNYDEVGYVAVDSQAGAGVTVAHRTLPLPSYVEVTSLESGHTILARVERRGPMTGARLIALSPAAQAQLGVADGAPVRVRRVNPPEVERAELRAGRTVPERLATPKSLVEVLRRKLPEIGSANLGAPGAPPPVETAQRVPVAPSSAHRRPQFGPSAASPSAPAGVAADRSAVTAYPLEPLAAAPKPRPRSAAIVDGFVVQAAAFASQSNAHAAANELGGFVSPSGKYFRVRTGPYATRGQAEAALAKVRASGYSDARVFTAG